MKILENVKEKYKEVPLIVPNYSSKKEFYTIEDLSTLDEIEFYLGEVNDHEADITRSGINFLEEVFGLRKLADELYTKKWYSGEYKKSDEIFEWLIWWGKNAR